MNQENDRAKNVTKYTITGGRNVWDEKCKKSKEKIEKEEPGHKLKWVKWRSPPISSNFSCGPFRSNFCFFTCHFQSNASGVGNDLLHVFFIVAVDSLIKVKLILKSLLLIPENKQLGLQTHVNGFMNVTHSDIHEVSYLDSLA